MDPTIAPSLEGEISRFLAYACLVVSGAAKAWHLVAEYFGLGDTSTRTGRTSPVRLLFSLDRRLDASLRWLGRHWETTFLLGLAFAIATIVPTWELMTVKRQIIGEFCAQPDLQIVRAACDRATTLVPFDRLLATMDGRTIDTFQVGIWLLVALFVGLFSQVLIGGAHTKEPRVRLLIVSFSLSILLFAASLAQDWLGR
jgi:hypothetical protein